MVDRRQPTGQCSGTGISRAILAFHHRGRAAEVKFKLVRGQNFLEQINADALGVLEGRGRIGTVRLAWLAVTDIEMQRGILQGERLQMFSENMFASVAHAEEEPHFAPRAGGGNCVQHA